MSNAAEFRFIGWCHDIADNHDKVWGYFLRPTPAYAGASKEWGWNCVVFWGRRGKAMQFKADVTGHELRKLVDSKLRKGYREISESQLYQIWPTFDEEMKMKLSFEVLAGNVK